jgi:hypothetical protein
MFKLNPAPEFTAPALLSVYGQDQRQELQVRWRHKSHSALQAWLETGRSRQAHEFLAEVIADIGGLVDAEAQPVPYSAAVLSDLLNNFHSAGAELIEGYINALQEHRRKNSSRPPTD